MRLRTPLRLGVLTAAAALALLGGGTAASVNAAAVPSPGAAACQPGTDSHSTDASGARVKAGSKAVEPELYPKNEANAYGALKDRATLPVGSVTIPTVFHMVSDHENTPAEKARWESLIRAQMTVLNDSYAGRTAANAANTPFRFTLSKVTWSVNAAWYHVVPSKQGVEKQMKSALYEGDARTLNVYAGDIGGGLLGWAYFPKGYNNGRDYIDGVVMLDESMPGGTAGKYALGDTSPTRSGTG